ncbi:MAG TPA: YetF domain-containing protein [Pirellulales bacterium]|jgi:uncharacterized membrane protein YcaP (DUF421 family)
MLLADGWWYTMWHDMFFLNLPIIEKIMRPIFVYIFLVFGVRLAGKRQMAQLNAFDLVVLLTLANTVQNSIIGDDNSVTGGIIGAATLLALNYFVVWYLYDHEKLDQLIEGKADLLIEKGKLYPERLKKELITHHELEAAARRQGFASLDDVDEAVLEPGGTISFCARKPGTEDLRHGEVLKRLDGLLNEIRTLAAQQLPPKSAPN